MSKYQEKDIEMPQVTQQYKRKENNPAYKGENIDRNLIHGPIDNKDRSCTDLICFILFGGFFAGMIIASIAGFSQGDPQRLSVPIDSDGNKCGFSDGYEQYQYLYFAYPQNNSFNDRYICVTVCPNDQVSPFQEQQLKCHPNSKVLGELGKCLQRQNDENNPLLIYNTTSYGRSCIPTNSIQQEAIAQFLKTNNSLEDNLGDLRTAWPVILGSVFIALFFGYLYLILMYYCAGCMTWACILVYLLFLIIGGGIMFSKANNLGPYQNQEDNSKKEQLQAFAIIFWLIAVFSLIYICCNFKKIKLAIAIIKCSVDYTKDVKTSFLVPLGIYIFYIIFLLYWMFSALYLYSSGSEIIPAIGPYNYVEYNKTLRVLLLYHFFGLLWCSELFAAYSYFLIASSTSIWYFSQGYQNRLHNPIKISICRGLLHIGSLAYGSAIITIISFINIFLNIFHKLSDNSRKQQLVSSQSDQQKNDISECCTRCCICVSECFEAFFRYITKGAYIQTALSGRPFCKASHDSFYLMQRHFYHFAALNGIGSILILLGKLFIAACTAFISYIAMTEDSELSNIMYIPVLPVIFVAIISYQIGQIFMSIYGTSADTILQCYCLDEELHKELNEPPKYTPGTLRQFMEANQEKQNKKENNL